MNLAKLAIARMMAGMRTPEYRATEKELTEQRADLHEEMQGILDTAKAEKRAMTEEEQTRFNEIEIKSKPLTLLWKRKHVQKASKKKLSPFRKMKQKNSWKNVLLPTIFAVSWNSVQM